MSLSQFIRDNTNDGTDIAGVLIDVMNGRIDGAKVNHRLAAARLLTIYGYGNVDDFTNTNTPEVSDRKWAKRVRASIGPDLTTLIKLMTDDGQKMVMFLIDVMEGRAEGANVGHRVLAAKELLNRGFGKTRSRNLPKPPGSTRHSRSSHKTHQRVTYPRSLESVRPEPVEGRSAPPAQTVVMDEPEPPTSGVTPIYMDSEPFYLDSDLLMTFDGCQDPNFDPYRAIHDEEYARTYSACPDPECEVHGQPKELDFDPNDYHY